MKHTHYIACRPLKICKYFQLSFFWRLLFRVFSGGGCLKYHVGQIAFKQIMIWRADAEKTSHKDDVGLLGLVSFDSHCLILLHRAFSILHPFLSMPGRCLFKTALQASFLKSSSLTLTHLSLTPTFLGEELLRNGTKNRAEFEGFCSRNIWRVAIRKQVSFIYANCCLKYVHISKCSHHFG